MWLRGSCYCATDRTFNGRCTIPIVSIRRVVFKFSVFFAANRAFCFLGTCSRTANMMRICGCCYCTAYRTSDRCCTVPIICIWNMRSQLAIFLVTYITNSLLSTSCRAATVIVCFFCRSAYNTVLPVLQVIILIFIAVFAVIAIFFTAKSHSALVIQVL